ncbi:hypothetical protein ABBQ38_010269 [Trebouxia sp. C0009 RCD-2024]
MTGASSPTEVDWQKLDKQKFIVVGAALFSGVTTCLFPLTVLKTRQMAIQGAPTGLWGAKETAKIILRTDGVPGLYRGFGTVVFGAIPARIVYLTTLEAMKSVVAPFAEQISSSDTQAAGTANFFAGAVASLVTQSIIVPVDVVSQRLMVNDRHPQAAPAPASHSSSSSSAKPAHARGLSTAAFAPGKQNGFALARLIIQQDGVRGLYRGFGASVATFVPSSAIWWSAYGAYQKALWHQYEGITGRHAEGELQARSPTEVVAVQTSSALLAGCTSAILTNPLDVVKTRLQVATRQKGGPQPSFRAIAQQLLAEAGAKGLLRGVAPRITSTALWSTCMVTTYEFLKRTCLKPEFAET